MQQQQQLAVDILTCYCELCQQDNRDNVQQLYLIKCHCDDSVCAVTAVYGSTKRVNFYTALSDWCGPIYACNCDSDAMQPTTWSLVIPPSSLLAINILGTECGEITRLDCTVCGSHMACLDPGVKVTGLSDALPAWVHDCLDFLALHMIIVYGCFSVVTHRVIIIIPEIVCELKPRVVRYPFFPVPFISSFPTSTFSYFLCSTHHIKYHGLGLCTELWSRVEKKIIYLTKSAWHNCVTEC